MWEGYDEPFHFSFIQYVTAHSALPKPSTPVSREVEASLHMVPLSWEQRLHAMPPPIFTEDEYWQMRASQREQLQQQLRAVPSSWGSQSGAAPAMYEAQQAPLYYVLMSGVLRQGMEWSLPARVLLVRLASVLCASLLVPFAFMAASRFFASRGVAMGTVAIVVSMPELMINIARASNESLALPVYAALTLLLLRASEAYRSKLVLSAGLVLGIGLLTKAYFLVAVPAFLLIAAFSAWRDRPARPHILMSAAAGLFLALLISMPWYWRNHALTGTWSGEENNVAAMQHGALPVFRAAGNVHWIGGITSVLVSHVWFGAWSFLKLPKPVYLIFAFGMALALAGMVKGLVADRFRSPALFVLLALYGCFWLGLFYDMLLVYIATGVSASNGWYMYAVIVPEILLVVYGLYSIVPQRWSRAIVPAICTAFAAIDLYGVAALMLPYYAGLIAHAPGSDVVYPASLLQVTHVPGLILSRLTANKPESLGPGAVAALALLYCVATLLTVGVALVTASKTVAGNIASSALET